MHAYTQSTYTHSAHTYTYMHTYMHTHTLTYTCTHTSTYRHTTYTHTDIQKHTRTHSIYTHVHVDVPSSSNPCVSSCPITTPRAPYWKYLKGHVHTMNTHTLFTSPYSGHPAWKKGLLRIPSRNTASEKQNSRVWTPSE